MENSVLSTSKNWDLDKICRVCLVQKKDMRPLFGELVVDMLMDVARVAIVNTDGWPDKICVQCVHQVSRCHAFKMRVEKSDQELRNYIKSLTVIVEEPVIEIPQQQQQQQQQQQRLNHSQNILTGRSPQIKTSPQHHQLTNVSATATNNPSRQLQTQTITTDLPAHHQQVVLSNGQLHNAQIINAAQLMTHNGTPITQIVNANQLSQLIQTGNTVQMIQQNGQSAQVVQIQSGSDDHCEIIVHPDDDAQYYEDVTEQLQNEHDNNCIQNSDNIIHINEDGEIEMEEEDDQTHISGEELTFELINSNSEEEVVESTEEEEDDKEYIAEFINLQTTYIAPGRYSCNLCRKEFKQNKWLQNHMKSHSNWIKANCKKQPQCDICHRSFKGPGMLRMHMKTHLIVDKTPTCTICKKTFKSKTILYRHRQTHQQKSYQCGNCNKHFSSPYTLNSHMTKKHILERFKYKCAQCEEIFVVVEMLKVHMQNTGHNGKSFKAEDSS